MIVPITQTSNLAIASKLQQTILLYQNGEFELAGNYCDWILLKQPDNFDALYLLGVISLHTGSTQKGIALITRALEINSNHAGAYAVLGDALGSMNQCKDAISSYERAIQIKPDFAEAHNNKGTLLEEMHRYEEALASYEYAIQLKPAFAEGYNNKGNALRALQRLGEALVCYEHAVQLKPDYVDALNNYSNTLMLLNRHEDAIKSFSRLINIDPDYDYAFGNMFFEQLQCCDWTQYRTSSDKIIQSINEGKCAILPFHFLAFSHSPADQLNCARIQIADRYPDSHSTSWSGKRFEHDKIRIAYISTDFREHAMSYLMVGLFEKHKKDQFETIAISFCPEDNSQTGQRVKAAFSQFIDVSRMNDFEVSDLIRTLEVDIAIDLLGFTQGHRTKVFSNRSAPIQVNFLGYPGTIGADYIDYILADRHVIPLEHQSYYSEKVVYLPDTYQVNDSKRVIANQTPSREEVMLPKSGFVFCCFNSNYKISPVIFDLWMRLLKKVEGSVLWMMGCSATARLNLKREATQRGVSTDRLVFASRKKQDEHLARHRLADLFLDTLPYNAHTTASDALWAGLPVLTCTGTTFSGRVASSLLHAVGLPELITQNLEEYEELALKLATTPEMLVYIKTKLLQNLGNHSLFDTDRFCHHIESAYFTMWERYQRGEVPNNFEIQSNKKFAEY